MVAAAKHVLRHAWRNAWWFLCWSHKPAGIGDILRKHDVFSMIFFTAHRLWFEYQCIPPTDADGESALACRPSLPILVIRDGHRGEMVLMGIVTIWRLGRTLWSLMPERQSATVLFA